MPNKFFRAEPKDGGEPVFFGLEDIYITVSSFGDMYIGLSNCPHMGLVKQKDRMLINDSIFYFIEAFKDYTLSYLHNGEYVPYPGGGE